MVLSAYTDLEELFRRHKFPEAFEKFVFDCFLKLLIILFWDPLSGERMWPSLREIRKDATDRGQVGILA